MNINDIRQASQLTLLNKHGNMNNKVSGIFACDLLSHVMGHAKEDNILITVLNNLNVLGVASLLDLSAVIFPHDTVVQQPILDKADELEIPIFKTSLTTAETVILLHKLGV